MSQQKIGVATATIIGMNAMIGAGIFGIPIALSIKAGPIGIVTTLLVALSVLFIALSLARVAELFPVEGSFYTYAKQWGGHVMGLISAGAYLIGLTIAMGLLTQKAGVYLQHYFPSVTAYTLGLCTLIMLTALNAFGMALS